MNETDGVLNTYVPEKHLLPMMEYMAQLGESQECMYPKNRRRSARDSQSQKKNVTQTSKDVSIQFAFSTPFSNCCQDITHGR